MTSANFHNAVRFVEINLSVLDMPDAITNELLYEVLRNMQDRMGRMEDGIRDVKARMTSIDTRLGLLHTDMALVSDRSTDSKSGGTRGGPVES